MWDKQALSFTIFLLAGWISAGKSSIIEKIFGKYAETVRICLSCFFGLLLLYFLFFLFRGPK